MSKHRNDIYGDIRNAKNKAGDADGETPAIPAATVLLLKDNAKGPEVLMLHKTSKIAFGGMWVFPGGKIDEADYSQPDDHDAAARTAAARETHEEAGIRIPENEFVWFAHWTPPASTPRRYATWFFATGTEDDHEISVDGGEIQDHQWIQPGKALLEHKAGNIDLAPPTWISLYHLARFDRVSDILEAFDRMEPRFYQTRVVKSGEDHRVALWDGDAGYEHWDADVEGPTHRLVMKPGGFEFLHTAIDY